MTLRRTMHAPPGLRVVLAALCLGVPAAPAAAQGAAPPFELPRVVGNGAAGTDDRIVVRRLRVEGHTRLSTVEIEAIAAPFLARPLRPLDLEELRQRVTRAYVERGYVNSGARLGDDAVAGETLTLRIVEGVVARVHQRGLRGLSERYLPARLLREEEPLQATELQERFQLLLADPLFERLNARLLPGDGPGRSLLEVDVTRARPWQLALVAHNHVAPAVGSRAVAVEGTLRNLLGWGDALAGTLQNGRGGTGGDLSWTLPLGAQRTTAALRLAHAASSVVEEPLAALGIDSRVGTREFTLAHPLVDEPRRRLVLGLTHTLRRNRTTLDGELFSFVAGEATGSTRIEAWRLFQEATLRVDRHVLAARLVLTQGRNNLPDEALLPQQPARHYRLWQLQGQASLALGDGRHALQLRAQAQHSRDHLVPLEQMAVGGRHTVRGWRENQLVRDNGWAVGAELPWPVWRDDERRFALSLLPFVDAGRAWNRGEPARRLAAAGLGLQATLGEVEGELFVARRLERRDTDTRGDLQDHGIHFLLRWRPSF